MRISWALQVAAVFCLVAVHPGKAFSKNISNKEHYHHHSTQSTKAKQSTGECRTEEGKKRRKRMQDSAYVRLRNSTTQSRYALSLSAGKAVRRKRERGPLYITFPTAHKNTHARAFAFFTFFPPYHPTQSPSLVILYYFVSSCFNRRRRNGMDGHRSSRSLYKRVEKRVALVVSHITLKEAFCFAFFFSLRAKCEKSLEKAKRAEDSKSQLSIFACATTAAALCLPGF